MVDPTHLGIFLDLKKIVLPKLSVDVSVIVTASIAMVSAFGPLNTMSEDVQPISFSSSPNIKITNKNDVSDWHYVGGHDGDPAWIDGWFTQHFFNAHYEGGPAPFKMSFAWPASTLEKDPTHAQPFFAAAFTWSWLVSIGCSGSFGRTFTGGLNYDNLPGSNGGIPAITTKSFGGFSGSAKLKPTGRSAQEGSPGWDISTTGFA